MMSELLTTGQMIDRLKDGEKAISTDGEYTAYWHHGLLKFLDKRGDINERIIKSDQKRKWRIVRYVSFEEAMKALREGKKIKCHSQEGTVTVFGMNSFIVDESGHPLDFNDLFEGKWTIEG